MWCLPVFVRAAVWSWWTRWQYIIEVNTRDMPVCPVRPMEVCVGLLCQFTIKCLHHIVLDLAFSGVCV